MSDPTLTRSNVDWEHHEITLIGCVPTAGKRAMFVWVGSPYKQTVAAATAFVGAHVIGEDDPAFSAAEVSVEDLRLWAASSVFEGFFGAPDGEIDGTGRISVKPVEAQSVVAVDGTEYRLVHNPHAPVLRPAQGRHRRAHKGHPLHPRCAGQTVLAW